MEVEALEEESSEVVQMDKEANLLALSEDGIESFRQTLQKAFRNLQRALLF